MFHIIIVDDEEIIRNGIYRHIKRTYPDYYIDGVFSDGKDAIDFLRENHADIVLTDIRMSEKSGIDVAQFVHENNLNTNIILLSAYQEFEYAKQAIQYNVKYYLSKPVKLSELNSALNELTNQMLSSRQKSADLDEEKQRFNNLLSIVKHNFYSDILLGILNQQDKILHYANKIGLSEEFLFQTQCAVFFITAKKSSSWHYGYDDLYISLQNLLREITGLCSAIPIVQENHKILYVGEFNGFSSAKVLNDSLIKDLNTITNTAIELLGINLSYDIKYCCENVFSLSSYHYFAQENYSYSALLEGKYKDLLSRILEHDQDGAHDILSKLKLYVQTLSLNDSCNLVAQLFHKIFSNIPANIELPSNLAFSESTSQEELFQLSHRVLDDLFNSTACVAQNFENDTIIRAKCYIKEHFSEDIGLEDIAGFVFLNPVYFSRFFKQYTNMTLTDYLTNIRIEHAKSLLKDHRCKIHEISKSCGYRSSKYFAKIFKQCTGFTPSEFRKNN